MTKEQATLAATAISETAGYSACMTRNRGRYAVLIVTYTGCSWVETDFRRARSMVTSDGTTPLNTPSAGKLFAVKP